MNNYTIKTWDDVNERMTALAECQARTSKEEALLNIKINKLRNEYETKTHNDRVESELLEAAISEFVLAHRSDFDKIRTKQFTAGEVQLRTNPPAVKTLNKKYNWKTVLELVQRIRPTYLRVKEELNKDLILSDYAAKTITDDTLAAMGVRIDQDETVIVTAKWEELSNANV